MVELSENVATTIATVACENRELEEKTILLTEEIYSLYEENKEKCIIVRYPLSQPNQVIILSECNVSLTTKEYCEVSMDIHNKLQLDFNGDVIRVIFMISPLQSDALEVIKTKKVIIDNIKGY